MKLSECIDKYINDNAPYLKERTLFTYNERKKNLIKIFGDVDIGAITQEVIQDYINKCQNENIKSTTIKNRLMLMLSALKQYKQFNNFRYVRVEADTKEKEIYSQEDIYKIENYIKTKPNNRAYIPIMLAINTGMRLSEIAGLKWKDVNFNDKVIYVRRNVAIIGKQEFQSTVKTKDGARTIPMTDVLYNYLKPKQSNGEFYVVTNKAKTREQRAIQRTNELLCEKVGVKCCGMHAYRHAFASKLLKVSQDFKAISQIMGHSNISITQNIYNHTTDEQRKNVIECAFGDRTEEKQEVVKQEPIMQVNYQPQIEMLQNQINELRTIISRLAQYVEDKIQMQTQTKVRSQAKPKYKVISEYSADKYFTDKKTLLNDLDITSQELTRHLNGYDTVLDDLCILVQKL